VNPGRAFGWAVVAAASALVLGACDTGDGTDLQPFDPADYPAPVESTTPSVDTTAEPAFATLPGPDATGTAADATPADQFAVTASWDEGEALDVRHTCDGDDISPAVRWDGVPDGTVEIALALVDDSTVSEGQPFVHWVVAGIDPADGAVPEGQVPEGAPQALNFFGDIGYGGPCPPPGDEPHRYRLTAYALNSRLDRADGSLATEFLEDIAGVTVGSADLTGTYVR
jgi:Raf kinase inhibitor-like YbhB/YbcL family protein